MRKPSLRMPRHSPGCSPSPTNPLRSRPSGRLVAVRPNQGAPNWSSDGSNRSSERRLAVRAELTVEELQLGTRGSQLALWQANAVASMIAAAGGPPCRIVVIRTSGDRLQEAPLSEIGGKRLFVKEIEDALLRLDIDLAVHSSKDMSAVLPPGL